MSDTTDTGTDGGGAVTPTVADAYALIDRMLTEGWTYFGGDMDFALEWSRYYADMQPPTGGSLVRVLLNWFFDNEPATAASALAAAITSFSQHTTNAHLDLPAGNGREAALLATIAELQAAATAKTWVVVEIAERDNWGEEGWSVSNEITKVLGPYTADEAGDAERELTSTSRYATYEAREVSEHADRAPAGSPSGTFPAPTL